MHWHNTQRLHGYLGDLPPAEFEETFYAARQGDKALARYSNARASTNPGRFMGTRLAGRIMSRQTDSNG